MTLVYNVMTITPVCVNFEESHYATRNYVTCATCGALGVLFSESIV